MRTARSAPSASASAAAIVEQLAVRLPDLAAGVAVLRPAAAAPRTSPKIKAPLLLHYAGNDQRRQRRLAGLRGGAQGEQGKSYTVYIYEGTQHGFHNDTTPRYDEAAAKLAWQRDVDFFNKNLRP